MYRLYLLMTLIVSILYSSSVFAKSETLPVPRFVSIKSSEANIRTGPNVRYPVKWVFVHKGEPVEVVAEFEQWRKIRDKQGDDGWIHESMLSGKRQVIITGDKVQLLYRQPDYTSSPIVKVEPEVRAELRSCHKDWCRIQVTSYKGWIERKFLWGIYSHEDVE
jgi:SH3-like domain-containing protein